MKSYYVTAVDNRGKTVSEVIMAENNLEVVQIIKNKQMFLLDYKETKSESDNISKLKMKSLVIFCRQLGTMVTSGIPIMQALDMLQSKADNAKTKKIFRNIYEEVQKGNSLSDAMKLQRGAFPDLLLNMILAGELGGTLDKSLARMSDHYEKEARLANKIKSASVYPIVLAVVAVSVVLMLVVFVLPSITSMFDPKDMPASTKIMLGVSDFILNNWIAILAVIVVGVVGARMALKVRTVRVRFDKFKIFMPVLGKLVQTIYSARCARAFASLYSSGVQTLDMIETTSKVLGNAHLEDMFRDVMASVSQGDLISRAIANTGSFDPMLSSMIYIGEESGSLGELLNSTADYFDNEADSAIQRMVSMIEPAMIIVLGIVIGFIVLSIIQPIFSMYGAIG
ncbi:MAG: type II secretion system F family protein [Firmicutes bacterium HGW-Firmicutes-20]|jgi:type IV pilus assembly protein PilC|nr:MAG: type II secretion system F family protein [Firmicutes bacterium HGW-Firmicutes-20]PKM87673.1 MAG: type II secretion system F family protein [Firmicutes bacterium HGW-Firmicutes-10]